MAHGTIKKEIVKDFNRLQTGEIYHRIIQDIEKMMIEQALEITQGNKISAARLLGIHRNTLQSKARRLNINAAYFKGTIYGKRR